MATPMKKFCLTRCSKSRNPRGKVINAMHAWIWDIVRRGRVSEIGECIIWFCWFFFLLTTRGGEKVLDESVYWIWFIWVLDGVMVMP